MMKLFRFTDSIDEAHYLVIADDIDEAREFIHQYFRDLANAPNNKRVYGVRADDVAQEWIQSFDQYYKDVRAFDIKPGVLEEGEDR